MTSPTRPIGRHFLQIPGPTPIPERVQQAMSRNIIDHRGPEFGALGLDVLAGLKTVFGTRNPVIMFPASGTGAWEAALTNTLSPGDIVLMVETGQFATLWKTMADKLGLKTEFIPTDWRIGADANEVEARLRADTANDIKAVAIVHNETATGCRSWIDEIRKAMDATGHPALLMVDTVSSLACMPYEHDAWGVDVSVSGSQKGLMLPPGLAFTAISEKALVASQSALLKPAYFAWGEMIANNANGYFPYTPATGLIYGLKEALVMLEEEGKEACFARHERLAAATRAAVRHWGLETVCRDEKYYSPVVTAIFTPDGHNADRYRKIVLERFNMSLGTGLNKLAGRVFRIGHLGDTNELTLMGALSGVEMGLELAGIPYAKGGVGAAMEALASFATQPERAAAAA